MSERNRTVERTLSTPGAGERTPTSSLPHGLHSVRTRFVSFTVTTRTILVTLILSVLVIAVSVVALSIGDFALSIGEVGAALLGSGSDQAQLVVVEWRLPRVLLAILVGAALAVSGAIFQNLTHNPLGSPDIIGLSVGSYTGALIAIITVGQSFAATSTGSLIGGLATAAVIYLIAYKRGIQGFRFIIVGIGVSAMLSAINSWLVLTADLNVAMSAAIWESGSLSGLGYDHLLPLALALGILLPITFLLEPRIRMLTLGPDTATALGASSRGFGIALIAAGVALIALPTATTGPIAFIALAAPQIARRLTRTGSLSLVPTALVGSLLTVSADTVAQRIIAPEQLPVGLVTVIIGGAYFIWLLVREARRS